jgi:DNA 3'-phosphatase
VVIFTNQGGLVLHPDPKAKAPKNSKNRVPAFKQKCNAVLSQLGIPITLYAATGQDIYRKPRPGMWTEMKDDYDLAESDIDHENSVFVGDAGGRIAELKAGNTAPKDFSCSDRNFAHNIGIKFQTPEEFFLGEQPREFARDFDLANFPFVEQDGEDSAGLTKANDKDIVLFVGPPGAGKSTFYWKYLKPLGYERVNQDILKRSASPLLPGFKPDADSEVARINVSRRRRTCSMRGTRLLSVCFPARLCLQFHQLTPCKTIPMPTPRPGPSGSLSRTNTRCLFDVSGSRRRFSCASTTPQCDL